MTRSQLTTLFTFSGLPYSEDPGALAELKKVLLLELKVLNTDVLEIAGKEWSKNDFLVFFDSHIEDGFDYEGFLADYPWVKNIETPEIITYDQQLAGIDFTDERFSLFAQSEAKASEELFFRAFKNYILANKDYYAAAMLLYEKCFSGSFRMHLHKEARALLQSRFNGVIALAEAGETTKSELLKCSAYLKEEGFYLLMKKVANDDTDLLFLNVEVLHHVVDLYSILHLGKIVDRQLALNQDPGGIHYLNTLRQIVENKQKSKKKAGAKPRSNKRIYVVLFMIFILIRLLLLLAG